MVTGDASDFYALAARLERAPRLIAQRAAKDVDDWGRSTERAARALAPEDTGTLRNGIRAEVRGLSAEVHSDAPYSVYVEEGTSDTAPQPFMAPALEQTTPAFEKAFADAPEQFL